MTIVLFITITLLYDHYTHSTPTVHQEKQVVTRTDDSLRIWIQKQQSANILQEQRYIRDSIRLSHIEQMTSHVPDIILSINKRTNDQIHRIDTMSAPEQFRLFSEWLTTPDHLQ